MICNNCNGQNFQPFLNVKCQATKELLSVVKCADCDLVFLNPRPEKNLGLEYFNKAYSNEKGFKYHSYYRDHQQIFQRNQNRFRLINALELPNKKILDFGAGQGHFVKVALDNGWQAIGTELSKEGIQAAKRNFNIDLFDSISKVMVKDFSVIALWDVIEHLEDPKSTLKDLSQLLHQDGYFIIETSNIDSVDFMLEKENWAYWHVDHLFYYSQKTLENLLNRLDFNLFSPSPSRSVQGSGKINLRKYLPLLDPRKFFKAIKRKKLLSGNREIANASLMTVVAKRITS